MSTTKSDTNSESPSTEQYRLQHILGLWLSIEGDNDLYTKDKNDATVFNSKAEIRDTAKKFNLQRKDFKVVRE